MNRLDRFPRTTALGLRRPARILTVVMLLLGAACGTDSRIMATYLASPPPVVDAMLELAEVGPDDVVYDLGSGDGRIVIAAAREYGARGVGVEIDPKLVERARANARKAGVEDRVRFVEGDIFEADLRPATVVTLYLYHTVNLRLRPKLRAELAPGARVVSQEYGMGDWRPDAERRLGHTSIYLWRIP